MSSSKFMATFCERFFGCVNLWKEGRGKQVIVQAFEKKGCFVQATGVFSPDEVRLFN